ncbi:MULTISPECIES: hypothetical protein [Synechococcales]|uniref:hypothetical protein n=1 Tax=Synechococcus sp. CS-1333 TaxID=2848638 RepID=UPI00223B9A3D|nr:hypothetical protein [Synechococcus sp. CS-1333]
MKVDEVSQNPSSTMSSSDAPGTNPHGPTLEELQRPIIAQGVEVRNEAFDLLAKSMNLKANCISPWFHVKLHRLQRSFLLLNQRYIDLDAKATEFLARAAMIDKVLLPSGEVKSPDLGHWIQFAVLSRNVESMRDYNRNTIYQAGTVLSVLQQQSYNQTILLTAFASILLAAIGVIVSANKS